MKVMGGIELAQDAVLISLRKKWWDLIKSGKKKIELRKSEPKKIEGSFTCYVYVPEERAVCGQFCVAGVAPVQPSEELEVTSCVEKEKQMEYQGTGKLYGWLVAMPVEYNYKIDLHKLLGITRAPQSWQYCNVVNAEDRERARID